LSPLTNGEHSDIAALNQFYVFEQVVDIQSFVLCFKLLKNTCHQQLVLGQFFAVQAYDNVPMLGPAAAQEMTAACTSLKRANFPVHWCCTQSLPAQDGVDAVL